MYFNISASTDEILRQSMQNKLTRSQLLPFALYLCAFGLSLTVGIVLLAMITGSASSIWSFLESVGING